ncbi:MAG: hypothetical protein Q7S00_04275, partial [bacterium]|nr:hypothetical protein [bacterium]
MGYGSKGSEPTDRLVKASSTSAVKVNAPTVEWFNALVAEGHESVRVVDGKEYVIADGKSNTGKYEGFIIFTLSGDGQQLFYTWCAEAKAEFKELLRYFRKPQEGNSGGGVKDETGTFTTEVQIGFTRHFRSFSLGDPSTILRLGFELFDPSRYPEGKKKRGEVMSLTREGLVFERTLGQNTGKTVFKFPQPTGSPPQPVRPADHEIDLVRIISAMVLSRSPAPSSPQREPLLPDPYLGIREAAQKFNRLRQPLSAFGFVIGRNTPIYKQEFAATAGGMKTVLRFSDATLDETFRGWGQFNGKKVREVWIQWGNASPWFSYQATARGDSFYLKPAHGDTPAGALTFKIEGEQKTLTVEKDTALSQALDREIYGPRLALKLETGEAGKVTLEGDPEILTHVAVMW